MKSSTTVPRRLTLATVPIAALVLLVGVATGAQAATAVGLGTANSFVVLAGEGVTNTGPTTLGGDLGTSPNPSVTGGADITFAGGTNYAEGGPTAGAKLDLVTAYDDAAGQGPVNSAGDLVGLTLVPGVYNSASTLSLTGVLTLDAQGDPNAVWIFQAGSDLIISAGASVTVINGAQACNVFWQVGSSASLGTNAHLIGTIMALTSITLDTGATVQGRVLARNGTVTLDTNTITRPVCAAAPDDSGGSGGTGGTGGTRPQVSRVPSGSVGTGDGSTSLRSYDLFLLAAGVVGIGAAGVTVVSRWHRRGSA